MIFMNLKSTKIKHGLLLCSAIMFLILPSRGQGLPIKISGKIDTAITRFFNCNTLKIKIHDPVKKLLGEEKMIEVPVGKEGQFKVEIYSSSSLTYLSFWTLNKGVNKYSEGSMYPIQFLTRASSYLEEQYIFEQGDDIEMFIGRNGYFGFFGKGSDKLKCQNNIYNMPNLASIFGGRISDMRNAKDYSKIMDLEDAAFQLEIDMKRKLMETYQGQLDKRIYDVLFLDVVAASEYIRLISSLTFNSSDKDETEEVKKRYRSFLGTTGLVQKDSSYLESVYYLELLFLKEWTAFQLYGNERRSENVFNEFYNVLKDKYSGKLRDRLLLVSIRNLDRRFNNEIKLNIENLIQSVQDTASKNVLKNWAKRQLQAFPFELQATNGLIHKLDDYKGKVIVIDFWFTGCFACVYLNTAMHPIMERYQDNRNIVFLSVNEDYNKQTWLKSIALGKYTSPKSINLYTNGLGTEHPILKYYGFIGAPSQLIIDKKGNLVSSSPPRPDAGEEQSKAFVKMIDDALASLEK